MAGPEQEIQNAILQYLTIQGLFVWRNNSGALKQKNQYGKTRMIRFGKTGSADIMGILPGGRFLAVEVKTLKGRLTEAQKEFLEYEDKAKEVATLQGELAGYKLLIDKVSKQFPIDFFYDEDVSGDPESIRDMDQDYLNLLCKDAAESKKDERWQNINTAIDGEIAEIKSYLLYSADGSRALPYCQGKARGMVVHRSLVTNLEAELKQREKDMPLFSEKENQSSRVEATVEDIPEEENVAHRLPNIEPALLAAPDEPEDEEPGLKVI